MGRMAPGFDPTFGSCTENTDSCHCRQPTKWSAERAFNQQLTFIPGVWRLGVGVLRNRGLLLHSGRSVPASLSCNLQYLRNSDDVAHSHGLCFFVLLNYRVISCERTSWTSVFPLQDSFYRYDLPQIYHQ
jgi:hypothetical protein